jgi:hypothetical protein
MVSGTSTFGCFDVSFTGVFGVVVFPRSFFMAGLAAGVFRGTVSSSALLALSSGPVLTLLFLLFGVRVSGTVASEMLWGGPLDPDGIRVLGPASGCVYHIIRIAQVHPGVSNSPRVYHPSSGLA